MPTPQLCGPTPDLGETYGAYLVAIFISSMFYGISIIQIVYYFQKYPKDPWSLMCCAAVLWIFDTICSILDMQALYHYVITEFGNAAAGEMQTTSLSLESAFAYSTMFITQAFFISRLWKLTDGKLRAIPITIGVLSVVAFGTGIAQTVSVFINPSWSLNKVTWFRALAISNKAAEFVTDISITIALSVILYRRKTSFSRTNSMLNYLILFAVNRGAIATILQVLYLVTFVAWPTSLIWGVFHTLVVKLSTNSVLAA